MSLLKPAKLKWYWDWCFLSEQRAHLSGCSHPSSGVEWKGLPPNPRRTYLGVCTRICSQVQNSAELVQESWLVLAILAKALQRHYVNTLAPAGGENAACGCAGRSCCASAACCYFLSSDLHLSPPRDSWLLSTEGKVLWITYSHCWGTVRSAIPAEQWTCHQLCLCLVFVAAGGVKLYKIVWPSREVSDNSWIFKFWR